MKAIIFDFFGVIYDDPLKLWLPSVHKKAHPIIKSAVYSLDTGSINFDSFLKLLSEASEQTTGSISKVFSEAGLNHDSVKVLKNLSGRFKTCLLSNAHTDELLPLLDKHNLHQYFDELVISSQTGLAKPNPKIFMHTLDKLKLSSHETLFIDDSPTNVAVAESLGIKSIRFINADDLKEKLVCVEL